MNYVTLLNEYSDGSHRTLSSTPTTQCGKILSRLLEKLGLSDQKEQYGLQIHYKYSGIV